MNTRIESVVTDEEKPSSLSLEAEAKEFKEKFQSDDQEITCNLDYVKQDLLHIIKFLMEITSGPGIYSDIKFKIPPDDEKFLAEYEARRNERHDYLEKLHEKSTQLTI